ncbi:pH-response regulator protein palC like [Verticillium longisporum]|uniref:pH-response regulator protein palC like n=1 Tax=Verticillium longisporum TaxID=100787 RepID=A0A8I3AFG2_VERLO|nr:pH-response regulator protein palC like [Verticillium longisporum]
MPFPFVLPTTSSFSFSTSFSCESHPSLPLTASTYRGVVRDALKKHKRLPPSAQSPHISSLITALNAYLPYLFAIDAGLTRKGLHATEITVSQTAPLAIEWRPTLSDSHVPGREPPRVKVQSLDHEVAFVLATLAHAYTLAGRIALQPLYVTSVAAPLAQERTVAIQTATKHLLEAASLYAHVATRAEGSSDPAPSVDISAPVLRGLASQAHAEATLLAVLKDDPYPAVVSQTRNEADKEWMYRTPSLPKIAGETGTALAWLRAALQELGVESRTDAAAAAAKKSSLGAGFSRLRKDWAEKREDKKVERETAWGADGGKMEETRVIEHLEVKWTKINDLVTTQAIPTTGSVLAQMPSGREIHTIKPFQPAELDRSVLEAARAPPDRSDDFGEALSSDDEAKGQQHADPPGAGQRGWSRSVAVCYISLVIKHRLPASCKVSYAKNVHGPAHP